MSSNSYLKDNSIRSSIFIKNMEVDLPKTIKKSKIFEISKENNRNV